MPKPVANASVSYRQAQHLRQTSKGTWSAASYMWWFDEMLTVLANNVRLRALWERIKSEPAWSAEIGKKGPHLYAPTYTDTLARAHTAADAISTARVSFFKLSNHVPVSQILQAPQCNVLRFFICACQHKPPHCRAPAERSSPRSVVPAHEPLAPTPMSKRQSRVALAVPTHVRTHTRAPTAPSVYT